jgi:hypothetical protein
MWVRHFERGLPSHDTLNDVINALDADVFKACFTAWVEALRDSDPEVIAIDGKTSHRSHARVTYCCARQAGRICGDDAWLPISIIAACRLWLRCTSRKSQTVEAGFARLGKIGENANAAHTHFCFLRRHVAYADRHDCSGVQHREGVSECPEPIEARPGEQVSRW